MSETKEKTEKELKDGLFGLHCSFENPVKMRSNSTSDLLRKDDSKDKTILERCGKG